MRNRLCKYMKKVSIFQNITLFICRFARKSKVCTRRRTILRAGICLADSSPDYKAEDVFPDTTQRSKGIPPLSQAEGLLREVSRPFPPRGLLWRFLRKKEQEILRAKDGSRAHTDMAGLRGRRLRPARRQSAAAFRSAIVQAKSLQIFRKDVILPPFATKRWRQKCPQGTSVGIGQRFSLSGHERLRCFAHPLRALEPPSDLFPPAVHCGSRGALRATMISVAAIYFQQVLGLHDPAM